MQDDSPKVASDPSSGGETPSPGPEGVVMPFRAALGAAGRGIVVSILGLAGACLIHAAAAPLVTPAVSSRVSVAVSFGVVTSFLAILVGSRSKAGGRAAAITSLTTLGGLPVVLLMLALLHESIVTTHWRCGTGLMGALMMAPLLVVPFAAMSAVLATAVRHAALDPLLRVASLAALVGVGVASLTALARMDRPDPDTYLASVPITGQLMLDESIVLRDGTKVTYRRLPRGGQLANDSGDSCSLEGIEDASYRATTCAPLIVRYDEKSDLWIVQNNAFQAFAFTGSEKRNRDVDVADVARSIAPPVAWSVGGLIGTVVGGICFLLGVWFERQRASFDATPGTLGADRWVTVAGRPPILLTGTEPVTPGAILLRMASAHSASYRDAGASKVVAWRVGTIEQARAHLQARAVSLYAFALVSSLWCAAPLLLFLVGR